MRNHACIIAPQISFEWKCQQRDTWTSSLWGELERWLSEGTKWSSRSKRLSLLIKLVLDCGTDGKEMCLISGWSLTSLKGCSCLWLEMTGFDSSWSHFLSCDCVSLILFPLATVRNNYLASTEAWWHKDVKSLANIWHLPLRSVPLCTGSTGETLVLTEWVKLGIPTVKQHWELGVWWFFSSVQLCQHCLPKQVLLLPFTWNAVRSSGRLLNWSIKCLSESPVFWVQQSTPPKIFLGSFWDAQVFQG